MTVRATSLALMVYGALPLGSALSQNRASEPVPPGVKDLQTSPPFGGTFFAMSPAFRICAFSGCNDGDHLRTQNYIRMQTQQGSSVAELGLTVDSYDNTGVSRPYTNHSRYASGTHVIANGNLYVVTKDGISAGVGSGPRGAGQGIKDGTVVFDYDSNAISVFKGGIANDIVRGPNGAQMWGFDNDAIMGPGASHDLNVAIESDLSNNSGSDCGLQDKTGFCVNLWLFGETWHKSTAALAIGSAAAPSVPAAYASAIWLQQGHGNLVQRNGEGSDIKDDASGAVGIDFGATSPSTITHSVTTIRDFTTSGDFLQSFGEKTKHVWWEFSKSPYLLYAQGTYGTAAFDFEDMGLTSSDYVIRMRNDQKVCWGTGGNVCLYFDGKASKFYLTGVGGERIASIDIGGNMKIKGKLTQFTAP